MRADKHGTWAGYQIGCRLDCCTTAARNYQKGRVIDAHRGKPRTVSCIGTRRRIEALACLGWSGYDVSVRLGHGREWLRQVLMCDQIHRRTHDRIAEVYEALSMTMPTQDTAVRRQVVGRTKARARRKGWLPPLAWNNPDDPDERPDMTAVDNLPDPVVVERILAGDWRLKATPAERAEVVERWTGSLNQLEGLTGWNCARDQRERSAA